MKRIKLLLVLLCLSVISTQNSVEAQEEKAAEFNTKKHQINIGIADIFAKNNWYSYWLIDEYGYPYFNYPGTGYYEKMPSLLIGYKNVGEKGAFRLGLNLRYSSDLQEDTETDGNKYTSKNFRSVLNLGYEWHSTFKRLNLYYGFDLSFSYLHFKTEAEYNNQNFFSTDEYTRNETAFGINPLLGINYFILPNLSIGTEVKLTAEYMSGKATLEETFNTPYGPDSEKEEQERSGFRMYFGPLGFLSINIHL